MRILVIIVSYNFEPWIERCLGSLSESDYPVDTIVIDNGSKDHTIERIQTNYPHIRLIDNQSNLGFGKANNIGMQIALSEKYEAVFLMNQDAWVAKNTIGELVKLLKTRPEFGILSPVHLTASEDHLDPGFSDYTQVAEIANLPNHTPIVPLPFVNAAFWMIPIEVLKKVGGFSSLFYHYGEDKDFINRLRFHQYQIGYSPNVFGCHDREYRPMTHQKYLHTEYVYHLSEYANINHSLLKAFALGPLAVIKKAVKALCVGKITLCSNYLKIFCQLIGKSKHVYSCRQSHMKLQPNYLL